MSGFVQLVGRAVACSGRLAADVALVSKEKCTSLREVSEVWIDFELTVVG